MATSTLDRAAIPWEISVEADSDRTIEAAVAADLAIHVMIDGTEPPVLEQIAHGGALPDLPQQQINLYGALQPKGEVHDHLAALLRSGFSGLHSTKLRAVAG